MLNRKRSFAIYWSAKKYRVLPLGDLWI